jgi:hypothetical protein
MAFGLIAAWFTTGAACDSGAESDVIEALQHAPANTIEFHFTDWAAIKASHGVEHATGETEREQFVQELIEEDPDTPAFAYPSLQYPSHAEQWGWDSTDLQWDASFNLADGPVIFVLAFDDDFDFDSVTSHFEERDFDESEHQGATIYSNTELLEADWITATGPGTELAIFNTAVVADEGVMILSPTLESVKRVLDVRAGGRESLADDENYRDVAERFEDSASVSLLPARFMCSPREGDPGLEDGLVSPDEVNPYSVFGAGLRYDDGEPAGRIVMRYDNDEHADADLDVREDAARTGNSLATRRPYSEDVFSVENASVDGRDLIMELGPPEERDFVALNDALRARDLLFAQC